MGHPRLTPRIAFNLAEALYNASGELDTRLETKSLLTEAARIRLTRAADDQIFRKYGA